jgi:hypothetical protein
MAIIVTIVVTILGIIGAAISRQLSDEFKEWNPWIVSRLIRIAVARLPKCYRDRLNEEWRSHVTETPGQIGKIVVAFGFFRAATKIQRDAGANESRSRILRPGIEVPTTGIYRVIHDSHRLMHEITLLEGQSFPTCRHCGVDVRFELHRSIKRDLFIERLSR